MSNAEWETRLREAATSYFVNVWRFLRRLGVPVSSLDDAAQEVFLVAAKKFALVRPGAEKSYLLGAAVHVARDFRRMHAREELVADPEATLALFETTTPEDSFVRKEQQDVLLALLDGLSDDLRTVFVLYEIEDESVASIAAMLAIPEGTVRSRLRRARSEFEARLSRLQIRMRGAK